MRFGVLGPLCVLDGRGGDGGEMRLGGSRQQLVLALLLTEPNRVVSTDALVDRLWGDSPPAATRHTVQGYISELRKLLGSIIEREGTGYVLRADSSSLDSLEFEAMIGIGRAELATDPQSASEMLSTALQLWRGVPFAGLDDLGVLVAERGRLEEVRLLAIEDRAGAELAIGRHREIVGELDTLSSEHPYREGLRAQHMLALYRSGRQVEALRAFQRTRAVLVEELGIEPSPLLRQLQEQILVQDPALDLVSASDVGTAEPSGAVTNPYKGLRAFTEADADDFFGRDHLVEQLAGMVAGDAGLAAVVGPSGSGKSSLVQAGLIPVLRAADRSDVDWLIALMRPGAYPFTELEAALCGAVADPPATSLSLLWDEDSDPLRAVLRILPNNASRLLLVVDQFEELFVLVDDEQRDRFLRGLVTLATDPRSRVRVLVTLRADFYDRPLMHPDFGRLITGHVVNVMPLAADELEAAALGPALRRGVSFEQGLLAALIAEVGGQPNALPLFQYTLTELFERRQNSVLTRAAYEGLGRIRGAVASRAEEIYQRLGVQEKDAARQLFLRLVTVGQKSDTRRVLAVSELITLDVDTVSMHAAVEAFVEGRLLVRDRDAFSGALTVEVAHEALLTEWKRLRRWIDDGRDELRQHADYTLGVDAWLTAGRDPDYLLTGGRLEHFERWRAATTMRLTGPEREFLDEALTRRSREVAADAQRGAEQARLRRRGRRRAFALGAAVAAITAAVGVAVVVATVRTSERPRIAVVGSSDPNDNQLGGLYEQGFVRAERDFDVEVDRGELVISPETVSDDLAVGNSELVVLDPAASRMASPQDLDPETRYILTEHEGTAFDAAGNVTGISWSDEQAGYLAGVAAASTSATGVVAFLGADQVEGQEAFRAGFEAGATSIDSEIEIVAAYLADFGYADAPYDSPDGARYVASLLYGEGADVIFHVAGRSGFGVFQAANALLTNTHLWSIGVDTDQLTTTERDRRHILTSIVKRADLEIYALIDSYLDGTLEAGLRRLTVADEMITYAPSAGTLTSEARATLDRAIARLTSGEIQPARIPDGLLTVKGQVVESVDPGTFAGVFAGSGIPVSFALPVGWVTFENWSVIKATADPLFGVSFEEIENIYGGTCFTPPLDPPVGPTVDDLVAAFRSVTSLDASAASDVTIDGFDGKRIEFTVPDYRDDERCDYSVFNLWHEAGGGRYWAQGPNQHHQVSILDVDGTRLVITMASFADATAQDRADLAQIMSSIRIG